MHSVKVNTQVVPTLLTWDEVQMGADLCTQVADMPRIHTLQKRAGCAGCQACVVVA